MQRCECPRVGGGVAAVFVSRGLLVACGLLCASVRAETMTLRGRALDALNGQTVTVLGGDNIPHLVRLAGIDTLPKTEPWGAKAKKFLDGLVAREDVRVSWSRRSELGYPWGTVLVGRKDPALALLKAGLAWRCAQVPTPPAYAKAEAAAKAAKRGMWADAAVEVPDEAARHPQPPDAVTTATPKSKNGKK